ncbi:TRL-like family protein [Bdellovibrio bacteriovorus]
MKTLLITTLFILAGCASPMTKSGAALWNSVKEAGMVTEAKEATKTGTACQKNILGIVNDGDSSIEAAKKEGGIATVSSVDYDIFSAFFLYAKVCTTVKGN